MEQFLKKRLINYEKWLDDKTISYSSKVIPITISVDISQWILPTEQVLSILEKSESFALSNCICRTHYKRCKHPVEACFVINDQAKKDVKKGNARYITIEEAFKVIKHANESGLVHLSIYRPDHELYAICNCCPCCCHDLQLLLKHGKDRIVCHADFVSSTDTSLCSHCGECEKMCYFRARKLVDCELRYEQDDCYGCGLCVSICSTDAISMVPTENQ
jgi:ferredoxin